MRGPCGAGRSAWCGAPARRRAGRAAARGLTTSLTRRSASRLHVPASLCGCTSCTSALGCGATHGTVARVCCGRQATGVTPTVHKVRFSSERGRCVTHWRSDGTTAPEPEHRGRERVLLAYGGITRGGQPQSVAGSRALLPRPRRASRARVGAPSGPARASCPGEDHTRKNTSEHI